MMHVLRNLALVMVMFTAGAEIAQSSVYRCGNEYTTSAEIAKERGCTYVSDLEPASLDERFQHPVILSDEPENGQLSGGAKLAIVLLLPPLFLLGIRMVLKSRRVSQSSLPDDQTYAAVAQEMEAGKIDKGLWARAFAENDGDEPKTRAAYIRHRAQQHNTSPDSSKT